MIELVDEGEALRHVEGNIMRTADDIRNISPATVAALVGFACENEAAEDFYTHIINGVADIREDYNVSVEEAMSGDNDEVGTLFNEVVETAVADDRHIRMQQLVGTRAYGHSAMAFSNQYESIITMAGYILGEIAAYVVEALDNEEN